MVAYLRFGYPDLAFPAPNVMFHGQHMLLGIDAVETDEAIASTFPSLWVPFQLIKIKKRKK